MHETEISSPPKRHSRLLTVGLSVGLTAIIILALVLVLPRIVSYGDVWQAFRGLSWFEIGALTAVSLVNILTYGPSLMAALPGLRYPPALTASLASSASTYVAPGGPAVGLGISFVMLRAWGFGRRRIALAVGLVALWSQLMTFAFPPTAFVILWLSGENDPLLATVSQIGLALLAVVAAVVAFGLRSGAFARRVGDVAASVASRLLRVVRRGPVSWSGEDLVTFRSEALGLLRVRGHWITLGTLAGHLGVYLVLLVTLRTVGVGLDEVSVAESFAAWSLVRLLGTIPILPGGLGVVEVGLTTALVGFGGDEAGVVASVVVYRFLTLVLPLVCGAVAGVMWRRHHPMEVEFARDPGISASARPF